MNTIFGAGNTECHKEEREGSQTGEPQLVNWVCANLKCHFSAMTSPLEDLRLNGHPFPPLSLLWLGNALLFSRHSTHCGKALSWWLLMNFTPPLCLPRSVEWTHLSSLGNGHGKGLKVGKATQPVWSEFNTGLWELSTAIYHLPPGEPAEKHRCELAEQQVRARIK